MGQWHAWDGKKVARETTYLTFQQLQFESKKKPDPLCFLVTVMVEWVLGVAMILLFLVYIASKYAFVKGLLGM
ncbi:MAG: hypothetical protein BGO55_09320 [Sphingobacteriales bacterium 50-39]|nr:MAG: hypothetical protein BGO55_09320 [Sphingobacteriales bacterium 50-39]